MGALCWPCSTYTLPRISPADVLFGLVSLSVITPIMDHVVQTVLECLLNISRISFRGFPGGSMIKNPPRNAGLQFRSWLGIKIPPVTEQLSLYAAAPEPVHSGVTW